MSSRSRRPKTSPIVQIALFLLGLLLLWAYNSFQSFNGTSAPNGATNPPAVATKPAGQTTKPTKVPATKPPVNGNKNGNRNIALGNPSDATADPSQPTNFLIQRPQYVLSYNRDKGGPNWVSWQVTAADLGDAKRGNNFIPDDTLPAGWFRASLDDYTGSGYDRGHMCPSADRTATQKDNDVTFILTNIVPQAPDNNRVTWEHLEAFSRTLVQKGHTLYIIAGGDGSNGTIAGGKIQVPAYTWKIVVVMPKGQSDIQAITADTTVIAIRVPNKLGKKIDDWDQYRVKVSDIEKNTGLHFFSNLPDDVQQALKSRIDPTPSE